MRARLRLSRLHCTQPANVTGDQVLLGVYSSAVGTPSTWLWTSGEEIMIAGQDWEVNSTTANFDGDVYICLIEPDEEDDAATCNYGQVGVIAASVLSTENVPRQAQFDLHGVNYTLEYRILAAATPSVAQPAEDSQLDSDLGMLKNGSRLPITRRLSDIKAAINNLQDFQNKVLQLARVCREAVKRYERERLESYLDETTENDIEKTTKATQLARDSARMEFLLGWMYYQGYDSAESWEINNNNHGPFTDIYKGELGNHQQGRQRGAWCTMFCGTQYRWLGFDIINATRDREEQRIFWSGYRLQDWARNGRNVSNRVIGDAINEETGGVVCRVNRRSAWASSTNTNNPVTWRQLWDDLVDRKITPQPGDILLIKHYGHTVMIDDVEADGENFYIYTIEGNASQAVRSQRINIRANSDVMTYKVKTRKCLKSNMNACVKPSARTPDNQIRTQSQRRYGIALIRPGWDNFAEEEPIVNQVIVASDDMENGASNVISVENLALAGELLNVILEELKNFMANSSMHNGPWIRNPESDRVWDWCGRPGSNHTIN